MNGFNGLSSFRADKIMGAFLESRSAIEELDRRPLPESLGLIDPLTSWYRRWYFLVRLDDALELARRDLLEVGCVLLEFPDVCGVRQIGSIGLRQELLFAGHWCLGFHDVPGTLTERELAVMLPDSGLARTEAVAAKLGQRLHEFFPRVSAAVCPEDGWLTEQLIARARCRIARSC